MQAIARTRKRAQWLKKLPASRAQARGIARVFG
jgi:hypothetical protein